MLMLMKNYRFYVRLQNNEDTLITIFAGSQEIAECILKSKFNPNKFDLEQIY